MDNKGQLSLEYVLIAMIGILLLTLISFPLLNISIDTSNDIIDSINAKNELNKLVDGINYCYASGKGSKRVILLEFNKDNQITISSLNNDKCIIKSNIKLSNSNKELSFQLNTPIESKSITFKKGINKVAVKWSENSNKIIINKL